jgi:hypothetical protein
MFKLFVTVQVDELITTEVIPFDTFRQADIAYDRLTDVSGLHGTHYVIVKLY